MQIALPEIEKKKTKQNQKPQQPPRHRAGKAAFLPSRSRSPAPRGFTPLSHKQMYFWRGVRGAWGSPVIFTPREERGGRGQGVTLPRSPSQVHGGLVGYKEPFPAPKPGGGAGKSPAARPRDFGDRPRRHQTLAVAILRQDISCGSPAFQSLPSLPSRGTGEGIWLQGKLPRERDPDNGV